MMVLVVAGTVLLLPPVAHIFRVDGTIAGLPLTIVYVFVVWMLLILGAAVFSRTLPDGDESERELPDRERGT